jgi:hypothetical protein
LLPDKVDDVLRFISEIIVVGILAPGALFAAWGVLAAPVGHFAYGGSSRYLGLLDAYGAARQAISRATPIGLGRDVLADALDALASITRWPTGTFVAVGIWRKARLVSPRVIETRRRLGWSTELMGSAVSLAFVCVLILSAALVGVRQYLIVGAEAAIIANIGQQLSTTLRPSTLADKLRIGLRPPVVQLAAIAFADFASLVLAAVIMLRWGHSGGFNWGWLPTEARHVLGFQHVSALWRVHSMGTKEVLVGLGGLAFYTVLLRQLLSVKQLRRTPVDRAATAWGLVFAGELAAAERWMAPAVAAQRLIAIDHEVLGLLALARGDFTRALVHAQACVLARRVELDAVKANDNALYQLLHWATLFTHPWGEASLARPLTAEEVQVCASVVRLALDRGISDAALAVAGPRPWTIRGAPGKDLAAYQKLGIDDPTWPLTVASLEINAGARAEGLAHLNSEKVVGPEAEIVASLLRADAKLMAAPSWVSKDSFIGTGMEIARAFLEDAKGWDIGEIPLWLREQLSSKTASLEHIARRARSKEVARALRKLRLSLVGDMTGLGEYRFWRAQHSI